MIIKYYKILFFCSFLFAMIFNSDFIRLNTYFLNETIKQQDIINIKSEYSGESLFYFGQCAFDEKFDFGLCRWVKDTVTFSINGDYSEEDSICLFSTIEIINKSSNLKLVPSKYKFWFSDIKIIFAPFMDDKRYGATANSFNVFNNITESIIFVLHNNQKQQNRRNKVIMHELLHAIGFLGHPNSYLGDPNIYLIGDAILSSKFDCLDSMPSYEKEAIKLLYDKRIPKHYTKEKFSKQFLPLKVYDKYFNRYVKVMKLS